jgi:hypothetical protein
MKKQKGALIWLVLAGLATGCARQKTLDVGEFLPYVQKFETVASQQGKTLKVDDLIMHFGQTDSAQEQAFCVLSSDASPTVVINEDVWNDLDDVEKEALIFHELGHCVLFRRHNSEKTGAGEPVTIMNPYAIDSYLYRAKLSYYYRELFTNR